MKYYEIWFYYYGEDDPRTSYLNEFTFYCMTEKPILTDADMVEHLKETFPVTEKYHNDTLNCIDEKHYPHMSKWFEISSEEFSDGCGLNPKGITQKYTFEEHDVTVSGEKHHMVELARALNGVEGTWGDIRYQIEYEFDIDGIRTEDE